MKRMTALILALVMMLALAACAGGEKTNMAANTDPLTKDDVIKITIMSHPSWPYREDWKAWEYAAEGSGATLDVTAVPNSDVGTKYPIIFASPDLLPDIITFDYKQGSDRYAQQGALVAFDDVAEYMPNYTSYIEGLDEVTYNATVGLRKAYDGKVYYTPVFGRERSQNVRAWMYRKDIFDKHNLAVPTTYDELYDVCKQLKALYPDSYPYCIRQKFTNLDVQGPSWKPYWTTGFYYDYETGTWNYGAITDTMLKVLTFHKKMIDEGLCTPNFLTINTASWQELITTDRGFIMPEYQTRIDFFNGMAKENNPEFKLAAILPPIADPETGVAMVNKYNVDPYGMSLCNTGDDARIANAAKYLNWLYSDEAELLMGWGKKGETYEVVDGKKVFITDETSSQPNTLYGFSTGGTFTRIDPTAIEAMETEDIASTREMVLGYTMPNANPAGYLAFSEEEQKIRDEKATELTTYIEEMVTKFLLGQESLSKWDEYVATVKSMGIDDLLAIYETAYNRMK